MKILQVVPRYVPAWAYGGPVGATYYLAQELIKRGHSVHVYTSDSIDKHNRTDALEQDLDGIYVRRFKNPNNYLSARYSFLFFYPHEMAKTLAVAANEFDLIHVVEARTPLNHWVAHHASRHGVPFVWSAYGGLAEGLGLRRFYRWAYDRVFDTKQIIQAASGLIAQTHHEAQIYETFGAKPAQIRLIPLAVNWRDYEHLPKRGQFREKLGISETDKLIVFLGRIHPTKGLQALIPAFAKVVRQIPEARLAVVGWDHGFLGQARRLAIKLDIAEQTFFPGPLYGPERFIAYVDADAFTLTPGVWEETSLAALEACACGTQCVITRQCEILGLEEAGAGKIVDYDINQIAQALIESLQDDQPRIRGEKARALVAQRFTWSAVADDHERFFHSLVV
jgi:glycosyltransferase involved in cell wall biosynthesis